MCSSIRRLIWEMIRLGLAFHFILYFRIHGRHSTENFNRRRTAYTIQVHCQRSKPCNRQRLNSSNVIIPPYLPMSHCSMSSTRLVRCSPFIQRHRYSWLIRSTLPAKLFPYQAKGTDCCNKISRQNPYFSS